jgi:hypothetical protein
LGHVAIGRCCGVGWGGGGGGGGAAGGRACAAEGRRVAALTYGAQIS